MLRLKWFLLLAALALISALPARAQEASPTPSSPPPLVSRVSLSAPAPNQVLQGVVAIRGSTALKDFASAELTFAYENNPTDTWFLIQESLPAVSDGDLAEWDTTTLTDGAYTLRLSVQLMDGSQQTAQVSGLRVRNYTPVETDTPAPTREATPLAPVASSSPTPPPTPTPLPTNPAHFTSRQLSSSVASGGIAAIGLFALLGLLFAARAKRYRE